MDTPPRCGDVVQLDKAASVQFTRPILLRVIDHYTLGSTPSGWIWLVGYQLDQFGDAVERREVFVQVAGLGTVQLAPDVRPRNTRRVPAPAQPATEPAPAVTG
jgi:hypothetical protein